MKLYACCADPACKTYQSMLLTLKVWGIDPTPQREGDRVNFDVTTDGWTIKSLDRFREMCRTWPKEPIALTSES